MPDAYLALATSSIISSPLCSSINRSTFPVRRELGGHAGVGTSMVSLRRHRSPEFFFRKNDISIRRPLPSATSRSPGVVHEWPSSSPKEKPFDDLAPTVRLTFAPPSIRLTRLWSSNKGKEKARSPTPTPQPVNVEDEQPPAVLPSITFNSNAQEMARFKEQLAT